jgi:hypothetical protein
VRPHAQTQYSKKTRSESQRRWKAAISESPRPERGSEKATHGCLEIARSNLMSHMRSKQRGSRLTGARRSIAGSEVGWIGGGGALQQHRCGALPAVRWGGLAVVEHYSNTDVDAGKHRMCTTWSRRGCSPWSTLPTRSWATAGHAHRTSSRSGTAAEPSDPRYRLRDMRAGRARGTAPPRTPAHARSSDGSSRRSTKLRAEHEHTR